jgi:CRISPR-associated protein Cas2
MRVIITYDIADDRRRQRVSQILLGRGERVQKSVFESPHLAAAAYLRLRSDLEGQVDLATDTLRYYRLCSSCADRIEHIGVGVGVLEAPREYLIVGAPDPGEDDG